ncbi:hypothetical protein [uncultured Dietzia sp.]|uniref:hypothetical protein n=1 Tax=uncultured Dietzia sp. TaxID=395519 RepID=UPI0025DC1FDC|nr:hypothetical protein [uncultured Dietzia sp.]
MEPAPGRPDGGSGPDSSAGSGQAPVSWVIGAVFYGAEVVVLALLSLLFGGLSAMLSDTCFRESTELICEPRRQTIMALTPITALMVAVVVMGALVLWRRRLWALVTAMVVTPLVPLVAFLIMQAVVTA